MLNTQYRMHEDIMVWSSDAMYDSKLIAAESVRFRKFEQYCSRNTFLHRLIVFPKQFFEFCFLRPRWSSVSTHSSPRTRAISLSVERSRSSEKALEWEPPRCLCSFSSSSFRKKKKKKEKTCRVKLDVNP